MTPPLRVSRDLELPANAVTEVFALLATRGAGKSYGSATFIEELFAASLQTVVIDPMGVYWGLRSGADGSDRGGLPVIVLGGERGDVPLEPTSGRLIADVVVESGRSFVLDLSYHDATEAFESKAQQTKFVKDFAERLFARKAPLEARTPLMLIVDEADEFAPQKPESDETKMLAAMIRIAKRGRTRGIGMLSITQRSAEIAKAILDLSSAVLFMRTAGPRDRKVIRDWFKGADPDLVALADTTLPKLDTGEAIVYSPHWLRLEEPLRIKFRRIRTFDSYKTPEPGEAKPQPQAAVEVDLLALGEEIRATAERAKDNDPKELKARISALERELAARPVEAAEPRVEYVPALDPETHEQLRDLVRQADGIGGELRPALDAVAAALASCEEALGRAADPRPAAPPRLGTASRRPPSAAPASTAPVAPRPAPGAAPERSASGGASTNGDLGSSAKHLLGTLGRCYPMRVTAGQLGQLADRKPRGGSWNTAMRQLKDGGFVAEESDLLLLTERGLDEAGVDASRSLSPDEVIERWRTALPGVALAIFDYLLGIYPREVEVERLAADLERKPVGGSWNTAVSTLVRNQLAAKVGSSLRASHDLFPRG